MFGYLSRFLQVGAVGFAIDAGILWLAIYQLDMPPILSRVISFVCTILVTFVLNARYTFLVSVQRASMPRYVVIQCVGAALNFLLYSWLVLYGPLGHRPLVALMIGSAVASTHNFFMMRRFVFAPEA